jgi:hypothetical protein
MFLQRIAIDSEGHPSFMGENSKLPAIGVDWWYTKRVVDVTIVCRVCDRTPRVGTGGFNLFG